MKFLLDAQLPPSLKMLFIEHGFDCIHTLDLELKNNAPDKKINSISIQDQRILVTKDRDFYYSFVAKNEPYKLILVNLGNTSKLELIQFFKDHFFEILEKLNTENMILLNKSE